MKLELKLEKAQQKRDKERLKEVFTDIYNFYHGLVAFNIYHITNDKEVVDELVDDTYLAFYDYALHQKVNDIKAFLITSSRNISLNYLKKEKTIPLEEVEIAKNDDFTTFIDDLKDFLGEEDYNLLYDYYVVEEPSRELAKKHNLSSSAIRMRIARLKKKVKQKYGGIYHV